MSVLIEYFDREKATIAALRDYHDRMWKIENDPRRLRELSADLTAPRAMSASPVHGGGSRREENLCRSIDRQMAIEQGYREALEYSREFRPCWERLTEEERDLLQIRFIDGGHAEGGNGIPAIMSRFNIGKTEAYNRSNSALRRLMKLLYW